MPTWLWDAGVGAVVRGRTYGFGNRNRIPTNAECMADPGLVVHRMQTLLQKSVGALAQVLGYSDNIKNKNCQYSAILIMLILGLS